MTQRDELEDRITELTVKNATAYLLAALKECVPWLESMPLPADDQHLRDMAAKTLNDVQAAIAKAEGK